MARQAGRQCMCMCRVFEPRYRRLLKCCQDSNGCFALASCGVGITAMLDRVQLEEDSSNSVCIRGGRRFRVQEGSAKVVPGTFGLTVVEPHYIYVSLPCSCLYVGSACFCFSVSPACSCIYVSLACFCMCVSPACLCICPFVHLYMDCHFTERPRIQAGCAMR